MDPSVYERVGLSSNPFQAAIPDPLVHIEQAGEAALWARQLDALHGRAVEPIAIVGPPGSGRSHRLAVAALRARRAGAFHAVHVAGASRADGLVARLASTILAGCRLGRLDNALAAPRW